MRPGVARIDLPELLEDRLLKILGHARSVPVDAIRVLGRQHELRVRAQLRTGGEAVHDGTVRLNQRVEIAAVALGDGARRAYSMANAPHTQTTAAGVELHIRHLPGGKFTDHVFGAMKEKEILRVEGPFGSFFLREDSDKPIVLLASGTGFAPIKALLEHMQFKGITRPTTLYWGGRRPGDLYMHQWMVELAAQMPQLRYVPVVSDALPEDQWTGRTGFVHQAVLDDFADLSGYQVYACGAPIVVESARTAYTAQRGLPAEEFFADSFTSEADKHGPQA